MADIIPFEAQMNLDGQRTCGAAALNMIYKFEGLNISQQSVWRVISMPAALGGRFARTYRLPCDANLRGMSAIAFKALDPIRAVSTILANGTNVIMNHRLAQDSGYGHYTVALSADGTSIDFHDPEIGPSQRRSVEEMRKLWQPKFENCEITGNFLIAIASESAPYICSKCKSRVPENFVCPECALTFPLQPASAIGCFSSSCESRLWELVSCPICDALFPLD